MTRLQGDDTDFLNRTGLYAGDDKVTAPTVTFDEIKIRLGSRSVKTAGELTKMLNAAAQGMTPEDFRAQVADLIMKAPQLLGTPRYSAH
jgi:hypothetical protein